MLQNCYSERATLFALLVTIVLLFSVVFRDQYKYYLNDIHFFSLNKYSSNELRNDYCFAGFNHIKVTTEILKSESSDFNNDECLRELVIDMPGELHQASIVYNPNHYFKDFFYPLAAFVVSCFGDANKNICNLGGYDSSHLPLDLDNGMQIFMKALIVSSCSRYTNYTNSLGNHLNSNNTMNRCSRFNITKTDHNYLDMPGDQNTLIKAKTFRYIREGGVMLLNISNEHEDSYQISGINRTKNVLIYTRHDAGNSRMLLNPLSVKYELDNYGINHQSGFEIHIVSSLTNLTLRERIQLFYNSRIVLAPHGAWIANAVFMPDKSLVFSIEKDENMKSYVAWDHIFVHPNLTVVMLSADKKLKSNKDVEICDIRRDGDKIHEANYELKNLKDVAKRIKSHFQIE